jgi:multidrug efflux pump subunit AcrA (membrane-fusion protein)
LNPESSSPLLRLSTPILCLATLLSVGCSKSPQPAAKTGKLNPVEISVASAESREVPRALRATGTLAADDAADITARVTERVISVAVTAVQHVKEGDVLFELEKGDLQLRLRQAQAAENQARSSVLQSESRLGITNGAAVDVNRVPEVISARVNAETSKSQAASAAANAKRYAEVLKTGDVSQSAYDQAVQQAKAADDQARMAEQQYAIAMNTARQSFEMVVGSRASLASAQVQVAIAQSDVNNATIRAPFAGFVSAVNANVGQFVGPTSKVAALVKIDSLEARLHVPEAEQTNLKPGLKVVARVAAFPDRDFQGTVSAIDPAIDANTRTVTILARIPNPGGLLKPGMFASARIELPQSTKVVYVPADAVMTPSGSNTSSVFVVDGESVSQKLVRLGERDAKSVGIINGLTPGARVAVGNLSQLFDGAPVVVRTRI